MQEIVPDSARDTNPEHKLSVMAALPAYNEEHMIGIMVDAIKPYVDSVIVVDDGSKDKTVENAENAGAMVFRHVDNKGYGGALQTIFKIAKKYKPDVLVILDSDGQHDPKDIPRFIAKIKEGYDLVIGSRFLAKESMDKIPSYRKVGMKVLDSATELSLSGARVSDTQCGYRAYTRDAYSVVNISGAGMSAGSEILVQIAERKLPIGEISIEVRYDLEDTSSQNPIRHGVSVLSNLIRFITIKRPLLVFGTMGLAVILFSIGFLIWSVAINSKTAVFTIHVLISLMVFIIGSMLITCGIMLYATAQRNMLQ
ncbi:MAG TPA: glycosyltransferase family 2 protein [Methanocorpusculum sp.]|nr:glycosyltransferase family 2 protein [Methanocorpusculum sp.]